MNKDFWERLDRLEELACLLPVVEWYKLAVGDKRYAVFSKTKPEAIIAITHTDRDGTKIGLGEKGAAYIAAANPAMVLEMIAEIKSLRQENERLNAEADWLADRCDEFCSNHNFCGECIMTAGPYKIEKCAGGAEIKYVGHEPEELDWREAAREAVRKGEK